jgi:tetratricopeptide (TPR) repeat protein
VIAILGVVILGLAAVLSALVFGLFNTTGAPRTAVERDLVQFTGKVEAGKAKGEVIAAYVDTLMRAGQLSKAKATLDQAMQTTKTERSFLLAQQAKLYAVEKQYEQALDSAEKAMAEAEKELKAFKKRNVEKNRREDAGAVMPASYETAALVKAEALVAKKDYAGAIKGYDAYLKYSPADSDILVLRAQAKLEDRRQEGRRS